MWRFITETKSQRVNKRIELFNEWGGGMNSIERHHFKNIIFEHKVSQNGYFYQCLTSIVWSIAYILRPYAFLYVKNYKKQQWKILLFKQKTPWKN